MKLLLIIGLFIIFAAGCGGDFNRPGGEETPKGKFPSDVYPLDIPEDYAIIPVEYPLNSTSDSTATNQNGVDINRILRADSLIGPSEVYRIQIFNSNTHGLAQREFGIATEVFDGNVYLDYEVPYYKVRVGNFPTRGEAEQYLSTVKDAGYDAAWVVRVNINIKSADDRIPQNNLPSSSTSTRNMLKQDYDSTNNQGY
jgi:hypothetical protein